MMLALTEAALQDRSAVSADVVPPQVHETPSGFAKDVLSGLHICHSWTGGRNVVLAAEAASIGFRAVVEKRRRGSSIDRVEFQDHSSLLTSHEFLSLC